MIFYAIKLLDSGQFYERTSEVNGEIQTCYGIKKAKWFDNHEWHTHSGREMGEIRNKLEEQGIENRVVVVKVEYYDL